MKVLMKKNLGSRDAVTLGVDFGKYAKTDKPVDAPENVAEALITRGWAELVGDEPIKAVPAEPVKAVPETASVKGK